MSPIDRCKTLAAELVAHNIRAAVDPRNLNPPCVLFTPPTQIVMDVMCGGAAEMSAMLIVPGPGTGDAWQQLENLMPEVLEVLPVERVTAVQYGAGDTPLPAYELAWTETVSWL